MRKFIILFFTIAGISSVKADVQELLMHLIGENNLHPMLIEGNYVSQQIEDNEQTVHQVASAEFVGYFDPIKRSLKFKLLQFKRVVEGYEKPYLTADYQISFDSGQWTMMRTVGESENYPAGIKFLVEIWDEIPPLFLPTLDPLGLPGILNALEVIVDDKRIPLMHALTDSESYNLSSVALDNVLELSFQGLYTKDEFKFDPSNSFSLLERVTRFGGTSGDEASNNIINKLTFQEVDLKMNTQKQAIFEQIRNGEVRVRRIWNYKTIETAPQFSAWEIEIPENAIVIDHIQHITFITGAKSE